VSKKKKKKAAKLTQPVAPPSPKKKKLGVDLGAEFIEEIKDAVVFLQCGPEPQTSIRSFVEDALRIRIKTVKVHYTKLLPKSGEIPSRNHVRPREGRRMS